MYDDLGAIEDGLMGTKMMMVGLEGGKKLKHRRQRDLVLVEPTVRLHAFLLAQERRKWRGTFFRTAVPVRSWDGDRL